MTATSTSARRGPPPHPPHPARPAPLAHPARDTFLIAGRHLRVLRTSPGRLIYPLVQPLVLLFLFVSVFGNFALTAHAAALTAHAAALTAHAAAPGGYRQFLIPGIMVENAALTAPVTGMSLLRDAGSGLSDRFRSLPMSRAAVLTGRLAADAVVFAVQAALLLGAGWLLGFRIHPDPAGLPGLPGLPGAAGAVMAVVGILATATAFGLALAVTSSWLALLINDAETAERVLYFPAIAIAFASSAFAPVGDLAGWMRPLARISPVTAAAGLIRSLADSGGVVHPLLDLGCWVAALAVLPGVLAVRRWQSTS